MKVWVIIDKDGGEDCLQAVYSNEADAKLLLDKLDDPYQEQFVVTTTNLK